MTVRILFLDIETVVDESVWTPPDPPARSVLSAAAWPPDADPKGPPTVTIAGTIQPPARDLFPGPVAWRPICVGCVLLDDGDKKELRLVRAGTIAPPSERMLLSELADFVGKQPPLVVTFNGRHFDLPVVMMRSLRYGISQRWYYENRDFRYRFSEDGHCDLLDHMTDHGAADKFSLDAVARLIGLPGKYGSIDGTSIREAFAQGRLAEIARYCLSDSLQTAFVWLRWQLLKGNLGLEVYRPIAEELLDVAGRSLEGFVARVDRQVLLLEEAAGEKAA